MLLVAASAKILSGADSTFGWLVIVMEVGYGFLLLGRFLKYSFAQILTLFLFAVFSMVSYQKAVSGRECGCFGDISVSSFSVFWMDVTIFLACCFFWPRPMNWADTIAKKCAFPICLGIGLFGITFLSSIEPQTTSNLPVVESMLESTDLLERTSEPLVVMFVKPDCQKCKQKIEQTQHNSKIFGFNLVMVDLGEGNSICPGCIKIRETEFLQTPSWGIVTDQKLQFWSAELF